MKKSERQRKKEKYIHLNSEFQRKARKDKKGFLSNQCKEIEGNNRLGKIRDYFKKIKAMKGAFHAKMGSRKDRNSVDLTKQKILRRGSKNTQSYMKKILMTQISTIVL